MSDNSSKGAATDPKAHALAVQKHKVDLTEEEWKKLHRVYDKDGDGHMTDEEIARLIEDYNENKIPHEGLGEILKKFDVNKDGTIDKHEMLNIKHHFYEYEASQYTR